MSLGIGEWVDYVDKAGYRWKVWVWDSHLMTDEEKERKAHQICESGWLKKWGDK